MVRLVLLVALRERTCAVDVAANHAVAAAARVANATSAVISAV